MAHPVRDPLAGHPGHLSPEHEHKLSQFRQELSAEGLYDPSKFDDAYLLRFLRARKFDLPKSKIMWTDFIKWRTDNRVDELYESFDYHELKEVDKFYPKFYHKTDKDGRPVYIEILGKIDVTKLYQVTTAERQLQRLIVEYERFLRDRLPVCSEIAGHLIETSCTIMDLKGVGVSQFWKVKDFVQSAASMSSNNYPETMGKFYIINAPWAFTTVWSFVKPWLDEVTVSKIQILSSDYMKVLGQQIPVENLPKFLGGGCECPEGCTLSNAGPWQDKELVEKVKAKKVSQNGVTTEDVATGEAASTSPSTSTTAPAPAEAPGTAGGIVGEEKTKPEPAPSVTDNSLKGDAPPSLTTSSAAPAAASIPATASGIPMTVVESKVDA